MKRPERKRTISSRKDQYMTTVLLVAMGALIFRIPLGLMIGDKGNNADGECGRARQVHLY